MKRICYGLVAWGLVAAVVPAAGQADPAAPDLDKPKPIPPVVPGPKQEPPPDRYPIDLATALRLAGGNNLQIALAAERVQEAQARLQGAKVLWLPSLYLGAGYTKHDGRIQDTRGDVIEVSRNSLFTGGGPAIGTVGVAGPATQPRMVVGMPLADALFAPLAHRQLVRAADAARATAFNDTLLEVALVYIDLVRAQGRLAIAHEAVKNAEELNKLVENRVKAGTASPADGLRARAELEDRRRQRYLVEEDIRVVSAELVRLLRLDPCVTLLAQEEQPAAIELIPEDECLADLIHKGIASRPEVEFHQALTAAARERYRQERWRPFVPSLQVGLGAGGFGGGRGSFLGHYSDRTDFDAMAVWEVRNLGLGNRALLRERASQETQTMLAGEQLRDLVAAEVTSAYYQVRSRKQQIEAAQSQVVAAAEAVPLNFKGILGGALRAIEAQQAIQTLAASRIDYLDAVIEHNRAQFQLLRAVGQPLAGQ